MTIAPPMRTYIHKSTSNKSFLDMYHYLESVGIKNNNFFLILYDPDLDGVDPRDPNLSMLMKQKVLVECQRNYWYFIREVVMIPAAGTQRGGGKKYQLNRGNLALNFGFMLNWNMFFELPRQQGKTVSILCRLLWEFLFGSTYSEFAFFNKKFDDSKLNLQRLKDIRAALPSYLRMDTFYGMDGSPLKNKDNVETLEHPTNGNKIVVYPAARNKTAANSLGRGRTVPRIWWDEYAFTLFNELIYMAAEPGWKTASLNALENHSPFGMLISTTPGDMTTDEGISAYYTKENATKFSENMYDFTYEQLNDIIRANTNSPFIYIRYTYQQLGRSEQWFRDTVVEMKKDWVSIRREVLLEWSTVTENSPFSRDDLNIIKALVKQPMKTVYLCGIYPLNVYKAINIKYPPIIGVDVSGGYLRDSSAITIIDSNTTAVCADMNCNYISPIDLAKAVYELVTVHMPNAIINVERNGGFGASVIAKLKNTKVKKNLYYEIKDKVTEERFNGSKAVRTVQKTKVYGLDSTKDVRDILIEILRERVEYHKDKFISPIIYQELETLEVKRSGKVEHTSNGHDDQIFSYLMALYVWYEGTNLRENYGIIKTSIKTDEDELDDTIAPIEAKYDNVLNEVFDDDNDIVNEQLQMLDNKSITFAKYRQEKFKAEQEYTRYKLQTDPKYRAAYENTYHIDLSSDMEMGLTDIPGYMYDADAGKEQVFNPLFDNIETGLDSIDNRYTDNPYTDSFF